MFFRQKKVTIVEMGELVFFKSIECLRKSKLKSEFSNQEKRFKEITLGYIIGISNIHVFYKIDDAFIDSLMKDTLSFLSLETLENIKKYTENTIKFTKTNLVGDTRVDNYLAWLAKKYLLDLEKNKYKYDENLYNIAYEDLKLYYNTLTHLFNSVSIDYDV